MKVRIANFGEDSVSIVKEMTEEQYYFLLGISEELDNERIPYSPSLSVEPIK